MTWKESLLADLVLSRIILPLQVWLLIVKAVSSEEETA